MTTIKVPKELRDRLNAIADERGRGTTLATVLTELVDNHQSEQTRNRLAYQEVRAEAEDDKEGMARARRRAGNARALLDRLAAGQ